MVITLEEEARVALELKKCSFFTNHIEYLRHVIKSSRLKVPNQTVDAIAKLKIPRTVTEIHSLLEPCNVFIRFLHNLARTAFVLFERFTKPKWRNSNFSTRKNYKHSTLLKKNKSDHQLSHCSEEEDSLHWTLTYVAVKSVAPCFRSIKMVGTDQ